ncbi:MAG: DUF417 family protein [Caldilineaceae bacterium]|nr:DUF417 family protein [Caldilineaceae bacterium]MCB0124928.1 DUF417 family protein [Caldilineaceae bacterium]
MVGEGVSLNLPEKRNGVLNSATLAVMGQSLMRYGLVLVIGWIGAMKFTPYEAQAIQPMVANSPLLSWVYQIFDIQTFSNLLGVVELAIALMIGLRPLSQKIAAVGSGLAVLMFSTTITFLFTTPGWEPTLGGFPGLSVAPGQFLVKDVVLLGVALWLLAEALNPQETNPAGAFCASLLRSAQELLSKSE